MVMLMGYFIHHQHFDVLPHYFIQAIAKHLQHGLVSHLDRTLRIDNADAVRARL